MKTFCKTKHRCAVCVLKSFPSILKGVMVMCALTVTQTTSASCWDKPLGNVIHLSWPAVWENSYMYM